MPLQLPPGRPFDLETHGVDPQPDTVPAELFGDLAGRRRTAVVLAVGDQQDRPRPDGTPRRRGKVLCGLAQGEPDRSVPPGPYARDGLFHGGPVQRAHRPDETGVRAATGPVGAVHAQPGRMPVGERVDHGAHGRAGALHPGPARTVVITHGAGGVEHHDEAASPGAVPVGGAEGPGHPGPCGRHPRHQSEECSSGRHRRRHRRTPAGPRPRPCTHRIPLGSPAPHDCFAQAT